MKRLALDSGPIHFIGIGGAGMSGIAEVMHTMGYKVQGSDLAESPAVQRLRQLGVTVHPGHHADHLGEARLAVFSSAIKPGNPELAAARARALPVVRRADMLAELMRFKSSIAVAGTHGKTTTTSLIAAILDAANYDPTVINGGVINAYGANARPGAGEWMVVEADESDGTFTRLPVSVAVVTNIDPEHLDHYRGFDALQDAFRRFVENIPFYGFAVMCLDHRQVQALVARIEDRRIVTYGLSPQADIQARDARLSGGGMRFTLCVRETRTGLCAERGLIHLPMPGAHNMRNALAAIAVGLQLGVDVDTIRAALAAFAGVGRRFSLAGRWNGAAIYDDYAHHPVEIAAVLETARAMCKGRVIAVVQPHRYTRLAALFDDFTACFNHADRVIVAPVYPAGEAPIPGINRDALAAGLRAAGHRAVEVVDGPAGLPGRIAAAARPGDLVMCMGAGDITHWANQLPERLAALPAASPAPQRQGGGR